MRRLREDAGESPPECGQEIILFSKGLTRRNLYIESGSVFLKGGRKPPKGWTKSRTFTLKFTLALQPLLSSGKSAKLCLTLLRMTSGESNSLIRIAGEEGGAMSLRAVAWNVEWAAPNSRRTNEILSRINQHAPDVVCLTETHNMPLSQDGHAICSRPDYGYTIKEGRRKVMLWSREPWEQVNDLGIDSTPPGRFVSGVTQTSLGEAAVIGVCIPWFRSRTEARRKLERKMQWEDHEQYLAGLTEVLARASAKRLMVMGDFNQVVGPDSRARPELQRSLQRAFPPGATIASSALVFQGRRSVDRIALSADWAVGSLGVISDIHGGRKLSDHFGGGADLSVQRFRQLWPVPARRRTTEDMRQDPDKTIGGCTGRNSSELEHRDASRGARFPAAKSLDAFDFMAIPSVNRALVMELARCECIQRRENVIAVGASGSGKTHVALGLGLAACQRGMSVGFTAAALVHELMEARQG